MSASQNQNQISALNVFNNDQEIIIYCKSNTVEEILINNFYNQELMIKFIYSDYEIMDTWTGKYFISKVHGNTIYLKERLITNDNKTITKARINRLRDGKNSYLIYDNDNEERCMIMYNGDDD